MNPLNRFSLTILLAGISLAALAAEPKPDFAIKTKLIETSVSLDAKIKADAALAADCLTEGKAWAEKNRTDADKERKQDPQMFRNGAWSMERKYEVRSVVDGSLCQHGQVRLHGRRGRPSEFERQHHPVGFGRRQAHQHPAST